MFLQPCGRCRDCTRAPISFSPDQTAPTFFYVEPCDPTPRTWLMLKKVRLSSDIRSTFLFFTILYLYCTHMIIIYTSCHSIVLANDPLNCWTGACASDEVRTRLNIYVESRLIIAYIQHLSTRVNNVEWSRSTRTLYKRGLSVFSLPSPVSHPPRLLAFLLQEITERSALHYRTDFIKGSRANARNVSCNWLFAMVILT